MRHWLPEIIALPILPFLLMQGRRTRRITPRLPEAAGPTEGITGAAAGTSLLTLLTLGESPVAGVGVDTHENGITGQLALAMAKRLHRPVAWQVYGKNGITAREALQQLLPSIAMQRVDVALVAFGVNDTVAFRPVAQWRRDLAEVIDTLRQRCQPKCILLSGVPPMAYFPALPQPLRWVMGMKANALDQAAREIAKSSNDVIHVPLAINPLDRTLMAVDGYHPSALGCTAWANVLTEAYAAHVTNNVTTSTTPLHAQVTHLFHDSGGK